MPAAFSTIAPIITAENIQGLCSNSSLNLNSSSLQTAAMPWDVQAKYNAKLQAIMQVGAPVPPPIDPRLQPILDAAEKEIETLRAKLLEAAKQTQPAPPLSDELKEVVFDAVRKNNPQQAMLIADGKGNTGCIQCGQYSATDLCKVCAKQHCSDYDAERRGIYLLDANERATQRERKELRATPNLFRWCRRAPA